MKNLMLTLIASTVFLLVLVFAFFGDKIFFYSEEKATEALKTLNENLGDGALSNIIRDEINKELERESGGTLSLDNSTDADNTSTIDNATDNKTTKEKIEEAADNLTNIIKEEVIDKTVDAVKDNVSKGLEEVEKGINNIQEKLSPEQPKTEPNTTSEKITM